MQFGDYRIEIIPDTEFRLDGGAMFGVVPRVLWEKVCPPDELNRVRLNMNCLFVETPTERILIDTGIGEKWTEKQTAIYGIFREKTFAETLFEKTRLKPEDISIVVNTHLHFDHAGGNTVLSEPEAVATGLEREAHIAGEPPALQSIAQFPNAIFCFKIGIRTCRRSARARSRKLFAGKLAAARRKRPARIKAR
jgi:glyoxylase-like metal-dependent hydrolase (beta-lactamase superfamily II)